MNVASLELSRELYKVSMWNDTEYSYYIPVDFKSTESWVRTNETYDEARMIRHVPAYDADYLAAQLKQYDFTIVNLNSSTFSLTSDSSNEPDAAILGGTLAEVLCKLAIHLIKEGLIDVGEK